MQYLETYYYFIVSLTETYSQHIPDILFLPIVIISHILFLFTIYFIYRKFKKRWRVKASYRYLKKINTITGENEFQRTLSYLRKIDPFIFEEMILSIIKKQGVKIYRNKRYTGDGGIDGKFKYKGKVWLIQAKRYKAHITKQHVVEFNDLVSRNRTKGIFVHTGKTGKGSKTVASNDVLFISGNNLILFLKNKKTIQEIIG